MRIDCFWSPGFEEEEEAEMSDKDSLDDSPEGVGGGIEIETMDEYECLELEKLIINEWGMPRSSLNRMICKYSVVCW